MKFIFDLILIKLFLKEFHSYFMYKKSVLHEKYGP